MLELAEAGKYRAVIDRRYLLAEIVETTKYVETLQKTGNVVITISLTSDAGRWPSARGREVLYEN